MNKAQLIEAIASGCNMTKTDASKVLSSFTDAVETGLKKGERVGIPGFGTFYVNERRARTGRNPRTGAAIQIAAKNVVKFKPSSKLSI